MAFITPTRRQTERDGKWVNLQVARSTDLRWEYLPATPASEARLGKQGLRFLGASSFSRPTAATSSIIPPSRMPLCPDDKRGLCLAVATASAPQDPSPTWKPLSCGEHIRQHRPRRSTIHRRQASGCSIGVRISSRVKVQELAADRMSFGAGSKAIDLMPIVKSEDSNEYQSWSRGRGSLGEAAGIPVYSGDNCCGPRARITR